jgi:hypothetical protein
MQRSSRSLKNDPEAVARSALERTLGATLTDSEWRLHRDRLLAYVQLLRSWDADRPTPHTS